MNYLYAALIGYFIGAFQISYIVGKIFFKKDIRTLGNGNVGASNALIVFGRRVGVLTGLVDILKSFIAILIVKSLFGAELDSVALMGLIYLTGFFAIVGHNHPFYLQFKGGKGTAALFGIILGVDYRLLIVSIIVFLAFALITDYIVIGTLSLVSLFLIYTVIFWRNPLCIVIAFIIFSLSIYKHLPNYKDIKNGTEKRIRKSVLKK